MMCNNRLFVKPSCRLDNFTNPDDEKCPKCRTFTVSLRTVSCGQLQPICQKETTAKQESAINLISGHKSSTFLAVGTELENLFFRLALVGHENKCSLSLLLVCVRLILLMMYYDKLFVKPAIWLGIGRPMCTCLMICYDRLSVKPVFRLRIVRPACDGRSFASSPLRRLASRGSSIRGFSVWWLIQFAVYLPRSLTLHDPAPLFW